MDEFPEAGFCGDLSADGLSGVGDHAGQPQFAGAWRSQRLVNESMRVVPYVAVLRCPLIDVPNGVVSYSSSERAEHTTAHMTCMRGFFDVHGEVGVGERNPVQATCVRTYANAPDAMERTRS